MPAETPLGFPYPLATDPLAHGAAGIEALATELDGRWPAVPGDLVWSVAATRPGAVLADGSIHDGTDPAKTALWVALGSVEPQNGFVVPDLRERVAVGAGPQTALLATDGVPVESRKATRHRHTPHTHRAHGNRNSGSYYGETGGVSYNPWEATPPEPTDGGSGIATDPLDGPGYVALNPFLIL